MERLVVLIIIAVIALINSQSKKKGKASQGAQQGGVSRPVQRPSRESVTPKPAQPRVRPAEPAVRPASAPGEMAESLIELIQVPESTPGEGESMMNWSLEDGEGCLGGSMAHEHTEGESRAEHEGHMAAMREREAREREEAAPNRVSVLGEMDQAALRRAVIVSEVLGKPRALRRR